MYVSDYGYASDICETKILYGTTETEDIRKCNTTNWLYNLKSNEYLLNNSPASNYRVFALTSGGNITDGAQVSVASAVRPTLYLKPNVQIMDGDGTSTNPYIISSDGNIVLPEIEGYEIFENNFIINIKSGTYPVDKYCVLNNDSNPSNCKWFDVRNSDLNRIGNFWCCFGIDLKRNTNYNFNIFLKDKKNNIVTKSYNYYQSGTAAPCTCFN